MAQSARSRQIDKPLVKILGGQSKINHPLHSDFDIVNLSYEGVSKASVEALLSYLGISKKNFAEQILNISVKTLERKSITDKMDKRTSSHVIEIAKVVVHALAVFEDEEKVKSWLSNSNRALNNKKPIEFFDTLTGLSMVNDVLGRIEEGVYS